MGEYYVLNEYRQVEEIPVVDWAQAYKERFHLSTYVFGMYVSTVFLGLNHQYGDGPPLVFETMVFLKGSWDEQYMTRCSTFRQALWMHIKGCCYAFWYTVKEFLLN
jgi:hypothetical protein